MDEKSDGSWALLGEAIVAVTRRAPKARLGSLPRGIRRLPGPQIVLVEQFVDSPVGPFLVLSVAEPAISGWRIGFHVTTCAINNDDARRAMRQRWGFPAELGALRWSGEAGRRTMTWDERNIGVGATSDRRPLPLTIPTRLLQRSSEGPIAVPTRLRALVRVARVTCSVPEDDPLAALNGRHFGFTLSNMVVRRSKARKFRGMPSIKPSVRGAEPGVVGMRDNASMRELTIDL